MSLMHSFPNCDLFQEILLYVEEYASFVDVIFVSLLSLWGKVALREHHVSHVCVFVCPSFVV